MKDRERERERERRERRQRRENRRIQREREIEVAMNGNRVVPIEVSRGYSQGPGRNVLRRQSTRTRGQQVIEIVRSHAGSHRDTSDHTHYSNRSRSHSRRGHNRGFWSRLFGASPRSSTSYSNRPRSYTPSSRRRSSTPFLHPDHRSRPIEYGLGTYLRGLFSRNRELCEQGKMMMKDGARDRRRERRRRLRRLRDEGMAIRMGASTVERGHRRGRGHGYESGYGRSAHSHTHTAHSNSGYAHSAGYAPSESRFGADGMTRRVHGRQRIVVE
jgi:hypothetical protein